MLKKVLKNNIIITNQVRSKLLLKNLYNITSVKALRTTINFHKLRSFNDDIVLEGLFFLEFISSLRGNITYYKKMYQEVNLQIASIVRKHNIFYLLILLKLFYFPLLIRRGLPLNAAFDKSNNYTFTLNNINSFLLLPDIFFKWNIPVNCFLYFKSSNYKNSKLYLQYWNFPISK